MPQLPARTAGAGARQDGDQDRRCSPLAARAETGGRAAASTAAAADCLGGNQTRERYARGSRWPLSLLACGRLPGSVQLRPAQQLKEGWVGGSLTPRVSRLSTLDGPHKPEGRLHRAQPQVTVRRQMCCWSWPFPPPPPPRIPSCVCGVPVCSVAAAAAAAVEEEEEDPPRPWPGVA
jgi:hypothetical protein